MRSHKGVVLTTYGQVLLDYVQVILTEFNQFETNWDALDHEVSGDLSIGIFESIAVYFWPNFYRIFAKKYPLMNVSLATGRSSELSKQLRSHDLDVAITVGAIEAKGVKSFRLYDDCFSFFVGRPLVDEMVLKFAAGEVVLGKEDAHKVDLILFPDSVSDIKRNYHSKVGIFDLKFSRTMEVGSFEAARELCNEGLGIAMLPQRVARHSSSQLFPCRFSHVKERGFFPHEIFASVIERKIDQPAHSRLIQELLTLSKSL